MTNHPSAGFLAHQSEDKSRVQTVLEHLEGTAALAEQFASPFGGGEQARLAGMLHDIGKYSEAFQARLQGSLARLPLYTALSARNMDTTGKTPAEVAAEIAQFGQTP